MLITELLGILLMFGLALAIGIPLGRYMARVYAGEKTILDFFAPVERAIFRISGIHPDKEMNWKEHLVALLTINLVWFVFAFIILLVQAWLPMNPDKNPNMLPDQAF